jgi:aspartate kinase
VYSADPRVVPDARRVGTLSYEETQELAECGARVLNAEAVAFAKDKGIAIYARSTASALPGADPSADGTVVRQSLPRMPGTVIGVASERDVLLFEMDGSVEGLDSAEGPERAFALRVLEFLDAHGVAGKQLHQRNNRLTLVVSRENLHDEARLRESLNSRFGDHVRIVDDLSAVSVVGTGINATFANVRRGTEALVAAGMTPGGVATSSFRITWMIARPRLDDAVRLLHATFLKLPSGT